jgi:hypothetical protein
MSKLRKAAEKGFLGFSALLNPDSVAPAIPQMGIPGGELYAQNSDTNEFGFKDKMKTDLSGISGQGSTVAAPEAKSTGGAVRSADQAARNEELMQQGYSYEQIKALELGAKLK